MVKGRVADGKPMIGLIGRAVAMVQTVGTSAAMVVGCDGGGHSGRIWGRWNGPSGARRGGRYGVILVLTRSTLTLAFNSFFP
jgi:hypothetical protein